MVNDEKNKHNSKQVNQLIIIIKFDPKNIITTE